MALWTRRDCVQKLELAEPGWPVIYGSARLAESRKGLGDQDSEYPARLDGQDTNHSKARWKVIQVPSGKCNHVWVQ
jgi:hypothetical protein